MDTQGMTGEGYLAPWARGTDMKEIGPMPQVKHPIYTPEEREELISIIMEAHKRIHRE